MTPQESRPCLRVWETEPEGPARTGQERQPPPALADRRRADAEGGEDATGVPDAWVPQAAPGLSSADPAKKLWPLAPGLAGLRGFPGLRAPAGARPGGSAPSPAASRRGERPRLP